MDSKAYQHILGTTYMDTLKYYGMNKSLVYLQHDNDPKHKSKSIIAWLNNNAIKRLAGSKSRLKSYRACLASYQIKLVTVRDKGKERV
ncbi:hypothetical protein RMCBS344292_19161 [Rhizopus microsporus]|nr:hypothetical protein RMCBS344292_19161 [Rhizopus microsporus]